MFTRLDTPPGTKIKLMGKIPMSHGFLLLARDSVRFLGGHVEKLVENWQLKRVNKEEFTIHMST